MVHNRGDKALGRAFTLLKSDGSPAMDFSYRRCIAGLKKKAMQGALPASMFVPKRASNQRQAASDV
jgi:hypothetical protein